MADIEVVPGLSLTEEEIKYLKSSERCPACGHLDALHNEHCCFYCLVGGCNCYDGKLLDKFTGAADNYKLPLNFLSRIIPGD